MKNFTQKVVFTFVNLLTIFLLVVLPFRSAKAQPTYCTPKTYYGAYYGYFQPQSFSTTGGTQNISIAPGGYPNPLPGSPSYPSYANAAGEGYYPLGTFTSQVVTTPGSTINFTVLSSTYSSSFYHHIWVDWNQNGSFSDVGEEVYVGTATTSAGQTITGSFTVPMTAAVGLTRLRFACAYYYDIAGPCYAYPTNLVYYGVIYDFNFIVSGPCGGTPNALSIASSPLVAASCPGQPVTITASETNYSTGLITKWRSGPSATGPFTTVPGANSLNLTTSVADTTYFVAVDSCTNSFGVSANSSAYQIPVVRYSIPYLETFNSTANNTVPPCYVYNDNNSTNFIVQNGLHTSDGTALSSCMYATDPASNASYGKNDFFTIPGLKLNPSNVYAVRFKYGRGKSNPVANTGNAYPEHLQVFVNNYQPNYVVSNVTSGMKIFDYTINFDNLADTTVYFTPLANAGYYFSWYSNTSHPGGSSSTSPGGTIIVDSVYVGIGTCTAPSITTQPASSASGCVGGAITMSVAASGTGNNYQWQLNGSNIAGATNSTYTIASAVAANAGTYICVISNACGSVTSNNDVVTVNALPTSSITPATTATICSASGYTLTANTTASTPYYQWMLNGVAINGATGSTFLPTATGAYTVVVTDGNSCTKISNNDTVNVNQSPSATVTPSGSTTFCTGDSVILFGPSGSNLSYLWYKNSSPIFGAHSSTYTARQSGTYYLKVTNTSNNCSVNSANQAVSVNIPPVATVTALGSTTICQGSSVVLQGTSGSNYTYVWNLNGSPTTVTSQNDTVTAVGNYSVTVAIGSCATTSSSKSISIIPSPSGVISPAGAVSVCIGSSVTITAPAGNYSYNWMLNGVPTGITAQTTTVTTGGNYDVQITDNTNNCSTISATSTVNIIALPTATISASASSICVGNNVVLNANIGTGFTYQWIKNGNAIAGATGATYTDNPTIAPAPTYNVVVTNSNGCFDTSGTTNITVNALPTASITAGGNTSFCSGGNVVLNASQAANQSYIWQLNGTNINTATSSTYTATASGIYTVQITNSSTTCFAISNGITTTSVSNPVALVSANGPTTFCPGGSVALSSLPSGAYTYVWLNGTTQVGNTQNYSAISSGSYRVKVTMVAAPGCFDTSSAIAVSLFSSPNNIIAPQGPTTFCLGSSVLLNTTPSAGVSYQWQLNGTPINNADSPSFVATAQGNYAVVVSNTNCSSTTPPVTVITNPLPTATMTVVGATTFCSNESVTLNANGGSGLSYQWTRGGVNVIGAGATSASYTTDTTGVYTVVVTDGNGCSNSATPAVNITVHPAPSVTITTSGSNIVCQGDTIHLFANSNGVNGLAFQWQSNGTNVAGALSQSYYATAIGTINYTVIAKSANGCYDTSSGFSATINPRPVPVIAPSGSSDLTTTNTYSSYHWYLNNTPITGATNQVYTPTLGGNYSVFVTDNNGCSGMSAAYNFGNLGVAGISNNKSSVKIYPNPATSIIHVDAPVVVNVKISTLEGRVILNQKEAKDIEIGSLPDGIYMIQVMDVSGVVLDIEKLVKTGM